MYIGIKLEEKKKKKAEKKDKRDFWSFQLVWLSFQYYSGSNNSILYSI